MSLLPNLGAIGSGVESFYNGVATQSVRINKADSAQLARTPGTTGNRKTWTWSGWLKRGTDATSGHNQALFVAGTSGLFSGFWTAKLDAPAEIRDNLVFYEYIQSTGTDYGKNYVLKLRDHSAWYHLMVAIDTTQATASNRLKVYVNGERITEIVTDYGDLPEDYLTSANLVNHPNYLGRYANNNQYLDGYLAEVNFVDGLQLAPANFGETKNGVWIPIAPNVSEYGTNGFRLKFDQVGVGTASSSTIGADISGKTNHLTSTNIVAADCAMPDSPENNFNIQNPLSKQTYTFAEGNLKLTRADGTGQSATIGTISVPSGKWYWEVRLMSGQSNYPRIGIFNTASGNNHIESKYPANNSLGARVWGSAADGGTNKIFGDSNAEAAFGSYDDGDVVQFALDMDNFKMYMGKNDTWYTNSSTTTAKANISDSSANAAFDAVSNLDIVAGNSFTPCIFANASADVWIANFGQDSTFAGAETATSNADANGIGAFHHAPPTGFLALCTANLPEPTISPNSSTKATDHFGISLYSGDNSVLSISDLDFQPDLVWIKRRNADGHGQMWQDSSRGSSKYLNSTSSNGEGNKDWFRSFDDDGFTVSRSTTGGENTSEWNTSGGTYVGWSWKANANTKTTNDAGTNGATIACTFQADTTAGFSIVNYTATGTAGTIKHGLSVAPDFMIIKHAGADGTGWIVYHGTNTVALSLQNLNANDDNVYWNDTSPTATVFSVGPDGVDTNNSSGASTIAYVWHQVEGYSKFGSYIGNASDNGAFVFLGFKPAWVMIKCASATGNFTSWTIYDNKRKTFNDDIGDNSNPLYANKNAKEGERGNGTTDISGNANAIDFLSNGFKCRDNANEINQGDVYIYMSFAEVPFKFANGK